MRSATVPRKPLAARTSVAVASADRPLGVWVMSDAVRRTRGRGAGDGQRCRTDKRSDLGRPEPDKPSEASSPSAATEIVIGDDVEQVRVGAATAQDRPPGDLAYTGRFVPAAVGPDDTLIVLIVAHARSV